MPSYLSEEVFDDTSSSNKIPSYVTMFLWQVGGNGGQTRQSGRRVEGYRQYHHRHSTDTAD